MNRNRQEITLFDELRNQCQNTLYLTGWEDIDLKMPHSFNCDREWGCFESQVLRFQDFIMNGIPNFQSGPPCPSALLGPQLLQNQLFSLPVRLTHTESLYFVYFISILDMSRIQKPNLPAKPTATPGSNKQPVLSWKEKLHPADYEHLRNTFDLFDEDHSGLIDPEEINKIMGELGDSRKETLVYGLIEGLKSKGKPINFDEFLELVCPKVGELKTKEGLRTVFNHADKNEDDLIDFEELKALAKLVQDSTNDDEILETLHSLHINWKTRTNEGFTFDEFYQLATRFSRK